MRTLRQLGLMTMAAGFLMTTGGHADAQVAVGIGVAPVCPYGYYEGSPYGCAPDGYYGPEWFSGGLFIGAGPWYHGSDHFYGHVDHGLDYRKGYHGGFPAPRPAPSAQWAEFRGSGKHDAPGH